MTIAEQKEQAVQEAIKCIGLKYSQAKRLQSGYRDCSSLVARAYIATGYEWGCNGRPVPRSLEEVYEDGFELIWPYNDDYASIGKSLPTTQKLLSSIGVERGDLIFAATKGKASTRANKIEHIIMATSDTKIVHARGTAYGVRADNLSLYATKLCAVTRFNPTCDLVKGHIGNRVKAMQQALNAAGATLTVDRSFGSSTLAAVKAFQAAHGLPVTGKGDAATRAALGLAEAYDATTRPTLKSGSKGSYVKEMQNLLLARGEALPAFGADGDFGAETLAALVSYQVKQGIAEDGVCGPVTWAHLLGELDDGEETAADDMFVEVTATTAAYVRTLPGSTGEIRGTVLRGAILKATGETLQNSGTTWYNVVYDGEAVWISGRMCKLIQRATEDEGGDTPEPDDYTPKGKIPDISKWQGKVDCVKLATEADFVIARGLCRHTKDAQIDVYVKGFRANGIPFGIYNFTYAKTKKELLADADQFIEIGQSLNPLYYVLDAEVSTLTGEMIDAWADYMLEKTGKKPGIYCAHHFYKRYGFTRSKFSFIWIPRYGGNSGKPEIKPAYKCDLWQFTSKGKIAGVSGRADLNKITGDGKPLPWFRGEEGA